MAQTMLIIILTLLVLALWWALLYGQPASAAQDRAQLHTLQTRVAERIAPTPTPFCYRPTAGIGRCP